MFKNFRERPESRNYHSARLLYIGSKIFENLLNNNLVGESALFSNSQNCFTDFPLTVNLLKAVTDWISKAFEKFYLPWPLRHLVLLKLQHFLYYRFLTRSGMPVHYKNKPQLLWIFWSSIWPFLLIFQLKITPCSSGKEILARKCHLLWISQGCTNRGYVLALHYWSGDVICNIVIYAAKIEIYLILYKYNWYTSVK